jgi:hypothetical protein
MPEPNGLARAQQRAGIIDRIARELFHAEVLEGRTERTADWDAINEYERELFRVAARMALRRWDSIAVSVALERARLEAERTLAQQAGTSLISEVGRQALKTVVTVAVAAYEAHLAACPSRKYRGASAEPEGCDGDVACSLLLGHDGPCTNIDAAAKHKRDFALVEGGR